MPHRFDNPGLPCRRIAFVNHDSGPMHLAAALGRPVLSVTGSGWLD
jgi:hypothetical protein